MRVRHPDEWVRRRLLARSAASDVRGWTDPETGRWTACREWGPRSRRGGYGRLWDGLRLADAHRLSHEVNVGPIPDGKDCLHRCDNPPCIEPGHLWCGTHQENIADMVAKGRHLAGRERGAAKVRGQPNLSGRGSLHKRAKLTEDQVRAIRRRLVADDGGTKRNSPSWLAREFGVSDSLIRGIGSGRNWSWL